MTEDSVFWIMVIIIGLWLLWGVASSLNRIKGESGPPITEYGPDSTDQQLRADIHYATQELARRKAQRAAGNLRALSDEDLISLFNGRINPHNNQIEILKILKELGDINNGQ